MRNHPLGRTGLFVSELCLGTMTFGGTDGISSHASDGFHVKLVSEPRARLDHRAEAGTAHSVNNRARPPPWSSVVPA